MATISVNGHVTRIFYEGRGVEVTEFYSGPEGAQFKRTYTAWFESAVDFGVGASGKFSGLLSTKIDEWTDKDGNAVLDDQGNQKRSIKIAINGARFTAEGSSAKPDNKAVSPHEQTSFHPKTSSDWATPLTAPPADDDIPF